MSWLGFNRTYHGWVSVVPHGIPRETVGLPWGVAREPPFFHGIPWDTVGNPNRPERHAIPKFARHSMNAMLEDVQEHCIPRDLVEFRGTLMGRPTETHVTSRYPARYLGYIPITQRGTYAQNSLGMESAIRSRTFKSIVSHGNPSYFNVSRGIS